MFSANQKTSSTRLKTLVVAKGMGNGIERGTRSDGGTGSDKGGSDGGLDRRERGRTRPGTESNKAGNGVGQG